jgi:hypothetical protein
MTDQSTALDGRVEKLDLTDGALTHDPERDAGPGAFDSTVDDGAESAGDRGKMPAIVAGSIALAVGVLLGMRWARRRREDTTVVVIEEPEAARWRRLLQRDVAAAA